VPSRHLKQLAHWSWATKFDPEIIWKLPVCAPAKCKYSKYCLRFQFFLKDSWKINGSRALNNKCLHISYQDIMHYWQNCQLTSANRINDTIFHIFSARSLKYSGLNCGPQNDCLMSTGYQRNEIFFEPCSCQQQFPIILSTGRKPWQTQLWTPFDFYQRWQTFGMTDKKLI
jgi:hypothetical protein